jgi:hypothetical protein
MAARRFLWLIVIGVGLVVAAIIAYTLAGDRLIQAATTPTTPFAQSKQAPAPDYAPANAQAWLARPGMAHDPSRWTPPGYAPAPHPAVSVFYVAPTAWISGSRWNAPLDDKSTNDRLYAYTLAQASAFNGVANVWAPAYRQATFGAFLTTSADAQHAIDFAYADVERAWAAFLAANPSGPIILAGHSQGSLLLARLIAGHIAGKPVQKRIVAAYIPGFPLSVEADLPAMHMAPCATPTQTGCLLDWMSYAEPAGFKGFAAWAARTPGLTGNSKAGTHFVCVNPLRGLATTAPAVAAADIGALRPGPGLTDFPTIQPHAVGARCVNGLLLIGPPPDGYGKFILPGNNYNVYDYNLFWANIRADVARRLSAFAPPAARSTDSQE